MLSPDVRGSLNRIVRACHGTRASHWLLRRDDFAAFFLTLVFCLDFTSPETLGATVFLAAFPDDDFVDVVPWKIWSQPAMNFLFEPV